MWQRDTTWGYPGLCLFVAGVAMMLTAVFVDRSSGPVWWLLWPGLAVVAVGSFCLFKAARLVDRPRNSMHEGRNN